MCGDVYLIGEPAGTRIKDVSVETSLRQGQITCRTALQGLAANERYSLNARVVQNGRTVAQFASQQLLPEALRDGRITFTGDWKADRLWDLNTPSHQYSLRMYAS